MVQTQVRKIFLALGTVNTLTVFSDGCEDALDRARDRVTELHKKLSAFDSESEIGRINKNAGKAAVKVSSDTLRLIESAVSYSKQTNGLFDITINPLSMLWKNAVRRHSLPENGEVEAKLSLTNYRDILNEAIINLGGTVITLGESRKIGIQNPFEKTGAAFASLDLQDKAVVSSGLYEQGFEKNGRFYHHIVHPKTGYPVNSEIIGVTLTGDSAEELDALSTTALMMGMTAAAGFLKLFGAEAVFVTRDRKIYTTDGLKGLLEFV